MNMDKKQYKKYAAAHAPKTKCAKNCVWAFVTGGVICAIAELINFVILEFFKQDEESSRAYTAIILVFLAVLLTTLGIFDNIAKHAGAGTLVPITGFANSIVSSAMEFKAEGFVTGLAVKMFSVAGPVIVYGTIVSVAVGIVYYIM